jgi:hypothetical protein
VKKEQLRRALGEAEAIILAVTADFSQISSQRMRSVYSSYSPQRPQSSPRLERPVISLCHNSSPVVNGQLKARTISSTILRAIHFLQLIIIAGGMEQRPGFASFVRDLSCILTSSRVARRSAMKSCVLKFKSIYYHAALLVVHKRDQRRREY